MNGNSYFLLVASYSSLILKTLLIFSESNFSFCKHQFEVVIVYMYILLTLYSKLNLIEEDRLTKVETHHINNIGILKVVPE
jgi:hypothetical protein